MKFIIEDIASFKSLVGTITNLASKKIISGNEQCILIEAKSETVVLTAMETGSHKIKYNLPSTIQEEGKAFILASKLKSLCSKLVPKTVVIVEAVDGLLKFAIKPYGTINENLYYDQGGFESPLVNEPSDIKEVTLDDDIIPLLLPIICKYTYKDKAIYFKTGPQKFEIYIQFSENSYIKYETSTQTFQTQSCQIYLKPSLTKTLSTLGKSLDVYYSSNNKSMRFAGDQGSLSIVGDSFNFNQSNTITKILELPVSGSCTVNHTDLQTATNWQSYNTDNSESVKLNILGNELEVSCSNTNEAAKIVTLGNENFEEILVSLAAFQIALKALGSSKSLILPITTVLLEQRIVEIGDNKIKILSLSPEDKPDCNATCIMYENKPRN